MSEPKVQKRSKDKVEKNRKKEEGEKKTKKTKKTEKQKVATTALSLLADESAINPTLSSLFAAKPTPPKPKPTTRHNSEVFVGPQDDQLSNQSEDPEAELNGNQVGSGQPQSDESAIEDEQTPVIEHESKRKRKRKSDGEEVEDAYMRRLAREEAREDELAAAERAAKRQRARESVNEPGRDDIDGENGVHIHEDDDTKDLANGVSDEDEQDGMSPPPRHETEQAANDDILKAKRTVFLGNVSTAAISSKTARKALTDHLKSFFESTPDPKDGEPKHAIESLRFRSTPYDTTVPKKAAFATKQLMDATTKSTNAYCVYSSNSLARAAAKHLNATIVLDRHLRVDEVAHPAKPDHKRCVFVGNLGFVDDESNIQAANEEEGKEKRKPSKTPADVEEGLWRSFGKCGIVESVRVVRDSTTRVGKGFAYVQFAEENAVEAALLYEGKKFPPMLPRKLRVSRAKAQKRNAKLGSGGPAASRAGANGYRPKISNDRRSEVGRAGKLFGRAGAAKAKQEMSHRTGANQISIGIRKPEEFVFEGHRASSKGGKSGLKLSGRGKKKPGKPTTRSARRGTAFKAAKKAK